MTDREASSPLDLRWRWEHSVPLRWLLVAAGQRAYPRHVQLGGIAESGGVPEPSQLCEQPLAILRRLAPQPV
ncbi:MAG TPA: hypothetical protein VFB83_05195, partial [Propionibacteriaceae bacterium]|nr:hypothetical protein [Propionibacteriaceae bacterium]